METGQRKAAIAVLLAGALALGFGPIFVRLAETGPAAAGFWRLALAVPLMAPFVLRRGAGPGLPGLDRTVLLAGFFFACDLTFWHYGIHFTSVANATVLANLTPIVVTLAAWWWLRERPSRVFLLGLALGTAGAAVMALAHGQRATGLNPPLGDALSAITTLWYAAYFLMVRQARRGHGAMPVMFWSSLAGVPLMALAMIALGEDVLPKTAAGWGALAGLAVMHVAGQGAITWALGRLPAATAAVVILVQPALAAALAWALFSETMSPVQMLGGLAALAGVAVAERAGVRAPMQKAPAHP